MAKVRNERERKVLLGVHNRDYQNGKQAEDPSELDYKTLNRAYEIPRFDNNNYTQQMHCNSDTNSELPEVRQI